MHLAVAPVGSVLPVVAVAADFPAGAACAAAADGAGVAAGDADSVVAGAADVADLPDFCTPP